MQAVADEERVVSRSPLLAARCRRLHSLLSLKLAVVCQALQQAHEQIGTLLSQQSDAYKALQAQLGRRSQAEARAHDAIAERPPLPHLRRWMRPVLTALLR